MECMSKKKVCAWTTPAPPKPNWKINCRYCVFSEKYLWAGLWLIEWSFHLQVCANGKKIWSQGNRQMTALGSHHNQHPVKSISHSAHPGCDCTHKRSVCTWAYRWGSGNGSSFHNSDHIWTGWKCSCYTWSECVHSFTFIWKPTHAQTWLPYIYIGVS